jgi:hypothetical protein
VCRYWQCDRLFLNGTMDRMEDPFTLLYGNGCFLSLHHNCAYRLIIFVLDHCVWFTGAFILCLFDYLLHSSTPKELTG